MSDILKYPAFVVWSEDDEAFIASVPQLEGCAAHGDSREEAIQNLDEVIAEWMKSAQAHGWKIPAPDSAKDLAKTAQDNIRRQRQLIDEKVKETLDKMLPEIVERLQSVELSSTFFYQAQTEEQVSPRRRALVHAGD